MNEPTTRDEDTRELFCARCGGRLTPSSDVCPSCGKQVGRSDAGSDAFDDTRTVHIQPPPGGTSTDRVQDLERAVATGKYERSQLLKHLVAKEDELDAVRKDLSQLRTEHERIGGQLAEKERDAAASNARLQSLGRRRRVQTMLWLVAMIVVAALSGVTFGTVVGGPRMRQASRDAAMLRSQLQTEMQTTARLRSDIALKNEALNTLTKGNGRVAENLAAERKELSERQAAVQKDSDAVAQLRTTLDSDRKKLAEARKQLDDERAAFDKRRTAPGPSPPIGGAPPPVDLPAGVMMWRGDVSGGSAVAGGVTIVITPHKATYGTLTNGVFPERPSELRAFAINGTVNIKRPSPDKEWGRLYLNVIGKGTVTVFLIWGAPLSPARCP